MMRTDRAMETISSLRDTGVLQDLTEVVTSGDGCTVRLHQQRVWTATAPTYPEACAKALGLYLETYHE